jgi:hypothetical protein
MRARLPEPDMNLGGWIFMTVSITAVLTLLVWCYTQILRRRHD